ncbi:MAG: bifunctional [glutamate--ammonia ligase]-adenylyl-L-tyrosine phosphorylase/[glutamate--ammonia-ligase] adenylyltransferase [Gammaproteobacteria bacterium]|nr:bifunctional [glutamate--ammonia ligase]-adenylyl-L-tyrosine phosphorylase/[glutamate--ammonia-ligase] adenylyltransferase [Gammaproteobacteria bacterium]
MQFIPESLVDDAQRLARVSPYFVELMRGASDAACERLFRCEADALLPDDGPEWLPDEPAITDPESALATLRRSKQRGLRHCLWWELGLRGDVERSYHALSDWAGSLIETALKMATRLIEPRLGTLDGGRFAVIGLGKLGGRELNLGSDVDLLFVWQGRGTTRGGRKEIDAGSYFNELARLVIRLMSERTEDGIVWPVDMRLRPGGDGAPICLSLDATLDHYLNYGQTWERAMLIKANVVAGDRTIGDAFLKEIQPFIYRRYLDYSAVAALADMKRRIDAQASAHELGSGFDVKRGHGGIREIEFFIQSLQLLHGGRLTALRQREGRQALGALREAGLIDNELLEQLFDSYRFWRRIEHALQARHGEQTHRLPDDFADYLNTVFSRSDLLADMRAHSAFVSRIFSEQVLPRLPSSGGDRSGWLVGNRLATVSTLDENARATMAAALARIDAHLDRGMLPERCRSEIESILDAAMPPWLNDANGASACDALADLIVNISGRATWIDLLATHRGALDWLIGVLSASRYLARFLADHPHMLEWPLLKARGDAEIQRICAQIDAVEPVADESESLRELGRYVDMARIQCALMIDAHLADPRRIGGWLADVADAATRCCLRLGLRQLGLGSDFPFVALAMGKHGSREMGLASDLDMVFILTDTDYRPSSGPLARDVSDYAQRLGRRIIRQLTDKAPFGAGYEFDARLRPSGAGGILVTTLTGFRDYQFKEAHTWEHQALCRARPVAGPDTAQQAVLEIVNEVIAQPRDRNLLIEEVRAMRDKMMEHLASSSDTVINLKQDAGGLVDIEFLAQFARLAFGGDETGTITTLEKLPPSAPLPWREAAPALVKTYLEYREVENMLRVQLWTSPKRIPTDPSDPVWVTMYRHTAFPSTEELKKRMNEIRALYERILDPGQSL